MATPRVLITGMSGLIGGIMHRALGKKYDLVALNRRRLPLDVDRLNTLRG